VKLHTMHRLAQRASSRRRMAKRLGAGILAVAGMAIGAPVALAPAAPASTAWTCTATAGTINLGGSSGGTLDPLHANPDPNAACADDGASAPSFAINDPFGPNSVVADSGTVFAQTTQGQAGAPTAGQSPSAQAGIENATVDLGGGQLHLTAQLANASAGASCVGGSPSLKSSSTVVGLAINGTPIPAPGQPDQALDQLFSGLSPLAPLVHVVLNHEYSSGDSSSTDQALRREAVRIELLDGAGSPVSTIVLGSATVGRHGPVCASTGGAGGSSPAGGSTSGASSSVGGTTSGGSASGGGVPSTNANSTSGGSGGPTSIVIVRRSSTITRPIRNGINGSSCAHMRMFFDLEPHGRVSKRGPRALTTMPGVRRVVRGYIRNCKGKPIVHAKIDVVHYVHGNLHLMKTGLRSRRGGKMTLILPNNLTTRKIVFTYRGFLNRPDVASRRKLFIRVRRRRHG